MKVVVQRVARAEVRVGGVVVGRIGRGILCLVGALRGDDAAACDRLAERVARFRIFPDDAGRMNRSPIEARVAALVVSQLTLAADGQKGRRPSFDRALEPERARELYDRFALHLEALGIPTETGRFGASMEVELINDGPATFVLEEPQAPAT